MTSFDDLKEFFEKQDYNVIMVADAETRVHEKKNNQITVKIPAGGVAIALDPIAKASNCTYITRGKTEADREVLDKNGKITIESYNGSYTIKRIFLKPDEFDDYYNGFSNQTLWPMCHVAFEQPIFNNEWYEGYKRVNKKFAEAIKSEIKTKGKTFIWIHDYQLALVPHYLGKQKNVVIGMFWHIPWPTWEVFRILPYKKEILESMLSCDYLAFHRGYQARNFISTVEREFQARVDTETSRVFVNSEVTQVQNLPLGIDIDVITSLLERDEATSNTLISIFLKKILGGGKTKTGLDSFFDKHKVILGVDRLDYTKGLMLRLDALRDFFKKNPQYRGKVAYVGLLAPSREQIPSYIELKKNVERRAEEINQEFQTKNWKPIRIIHNVFSREDLLRIYKKSNVCLITPRDDGMNLVSKEFVISASFASDPGMLVLSQFAGSAIDLTSALIVNPYDINEVSTAIKRALEMSKTEKERRIKEMVENLDEKNIYDWAIDFVKNASNAARTSQIR